METTSTPRFIGSSESTSMRADHPFTSRIQKSSLSDEPRETKYRFKRKRTHSEEDSLPSKYSRCPRPHTSQHNHPRHSSESTYYRHQRRECCDTPVTPRHHERRKSESERHAKKHHGRVPDTRPVNKYTHRDSPQRHGSRTTNDDNHRTLLAESFIRSVSGTYKMMNRAEDRKRILSNQLPSCIKSKCIANPFMFCTSADGDLLESEVASMRRHQKHITDFSRLDRAIHRVGCRIRKRPSPSVFTEQQTSMIRAIRIISIAFNRITYVARVKHYCDKDSRLSNYLRDQLTKRCSEGSRLNFGIRRFISAVNLEKNKDLCLVFVGMLNQTPHMWARSIRLLLRLKIFYQNVLMKMLMEEKIDIREVFDMQYHPTAQKLLSQVKQYTNSAFALNDTVNTVADMIRQRQNDSIPQNQDVYDRFVTCSPPKTPIPRPDIHAPYYQKSECQSNASSNTSSPRDDDTDSDTSDTDSSEGSRTLDDSDSESHRQTSPMSKSPVPRSATPMTPPSRSPRSHSPSTSCSSSSSSNSSKSSSTFPRTPSLTFSPCPRHPSDGSMSPECPIKHTRGNTYEWSRDSPGNFISVHVGRSTPPTQPHPECIILLENNRECI
ncbi:B34 [Murid betaherpesvirus 8]|uniref:B34 n=2 Tax=Rat cytomegalovirus (isolate England) TaxID=1261657 RepID=K7XXT4_RCMVE|nr:E34 [Murid betaherpesvirus 8]AKE44210.1 a34 [Rat cytomegalovirus ALL-03]AFX83355.1 E34 [Murid betaherpesvirus 8]AKB93235.1 B34 [Murid betaherpesvirus 8]WEG71827.1 protein UL34 [Murid betaherpesvirus 8]WPH24950.1 B34 [Murid betaherpesvirus 8]